MGEQAMSSYSAIAGSTTLVSEEQLQEQLHTPISGLRWNLYMHTYKQSSVNNIHSDVIHMLRYLTLHQFLQCFTDTITIQPNLLEACEGRQSGECIQIF